MKSKDVVFLFFSTLLIGIGADIITGFILKLPTGGIKAFFLYIVGLIGFGAIYSVFSQMGFFAYLTVHRFGLGIFKSQALWNGVQLVITVFVLFDLFYLRYTAFYKKGESIASYFIIPIVVLVIGLIVAYFKQKATNRGAFIPTLFFIVVVTTVEWVPVLKQNDVYANWMAFVPLILCNAYQILILHRLNQQNAKRTSAQG
ncbi:KinB-signaling pathway activation protein [Fictibacillus sp. Mic-4]|uniref:KinB-signaling pathway activation protein n=1 Tax=Fictibacillus TaxID=1329200 RepID=UPI00047B6EB8|nr:KinB-signaling pathway activation protein [Fictibacillus gelatini]